MAEIKRADNGRPYAPDPETGVVRTWTRPSTLAKTLSDGFGLERWKLRKVAQGMSLRKDLVVRAAAADDDRDKLDEVVEVAMDAASATVAREIGSALHALLEQIDLDQAPAVPMDFQPDIDAYATEMAKAGASVVPGWVERFVVIPEAEAAGTIDRLLRVDGWPLPVIGDIKTGSDWVTGQGLLEVAIQMAAYSRAARTWDGESLRPVPAVDQERGVLIWMPAGQGKCKLFKVDLVKGWGLVELCLLVRRARGSWKSLGEPMVQLQAEPEAKGPVEAGITNGDPDEAVRTRVREVVTALEGAPLPVAWPVGVAPPKRATRPYSEFERRRILEWCDQVAPKTTKEPF